MRRSRFYFLQVSLLFIVTLAGFHDGNHENFAKTLKKKWRFYNREYQLKIYTIMSEGDRWSKWIMMFGNYAIKISPQRGLSAMLEGKKDSCRWKQLKTRVSWVGDSKITTQNNRRMPYWLRNRSLTPSHINSFLPSWAPDLLKWCNNIWLKECAPYCSSQCTNSKYFSRSSGWK